MKKNILKIVLTSTLFLLLFLLQNSIWAKRATATNLPTATISALPGAINYYGVYGSLDPVGQNPTLTWTTTNATSVSIDNGIGSVATSGTVSIHPTVADSTSISTIYTLTATNAAGSITATLGVIAYGGILPSPLPNTIAGGGDSLTITSSKESSQGLEGIVNQPITFFANFKNNNVHITGADCKITFAESQPYMGATQSITTEQMTDNGSNYVYTRNFSIPQNQVYDVSCFDSINNVRLYARDFVRVNIDSNGAPYTYSRTLDSSSLQRLVTPQDVEYMGAFNFPGVSGISRWGYAGSLYKGEGLTFYPNGDPSGPNDGYSGSLFGFGFPDQRAVSEISIPAPVIPITKQHIPGCCGQPLAEAPYATTLQPFADLSGGIASSIASLFPGVSTVGGGLLYLPKQGSQTSDKLYWSYKDTYPAGTADTNVTGWSNLNLSNPQAAGPWAIAGHPMTETDSYMFEIPKTWADQYLEGKYLATGTYGMESINSRWSHGPAIIAIAPWQQGNPPTSGTSLNSKTILFYPPGQHEVFPYNSDGSTGAAWLTLENKSAVMFPTVRAVGSWTYEASRLGGCYGATGDYDWPIVPRLLFYDPNDLAQVAQGSLNPWDPQPYLTMELSDYFVPTCEPSIGGVAYDRNNGLVYVVQGNLGESPVVQVFQVTDSCRKVNKKSAANMSTMLTVSDDVACSAAVNSPVGITAEYTNSSSPLVGASCSLTLPSGSTIPMTDIGNGKYKTTRSFSSQGKPRYTVSCNKSGANPVSLESMVIVGSNAPATKTGDLNSDGKVDIFDYNIFIGNFGRTGTGIVGDLNFDGKVDIFDYNLLVGNFGK